MSAIIEKADKICTRICDGDKDGNLSMLEIRRQISSRLVALGYNEKESMAAARMVM